MENKKWRTYAGEYLDGLMPDVLEPFIIAELDKGEELKLCIGTDSQARNKLTDFATVVVMLRKQRGGRMFIHKFSQKKIYSLNERLITEVAYSLEVASKLGKLIDKYNIGLEVHADINSDPKFKSEGVFAAAKGYILGMGYEFKAKPYAFASSSCADKIVN